MNPKKLGGMSRNLLLAPWSGVTFDSQFLSRLNLLLKLSVFLLSVYVIYSYSVAIKRTPKIPATETINQTVLTLRLEEKSYDFYAQTIGKRDIFNLAPPAASVPAVQVSVEQKQQAVEFVRNLKLVGIVLDKTPLAIIENLQTQDTIFLNKGGKLGDAVLEDIQEDKIVMKYKGQRIEIVP